MELKGEKVHRDWSKVAMAANHTLEVIEIGLIRVHPKCLSPPSFTSRCILFGICGVVGPRGVVEPMDMLMYPVDWGEYVAGGKCRRGGTAGDGFAGD